MKKYGISIISAVIGSLITLGVFFAFVPIGRTPVVIEHIADVPAENTLHVINTRGDTVPINFVETAKKVTDAVVNIQSTQIMKYSRSNELNQIPEPFRQFFYGPNGGNNPQGQETPQVNVGLGSGVILNSNGYIVTNNHVIAGADDILVTLHDNRSFKAKVVGTDPTTDIALVHIDATNLHSIPLANSDDIQVGQWVLAVGNPFNLNSTVTAGIISAKGRNINILQERNAIESFLQTDAAINPGNSGGALVDIQGGLVGINTAIASPTGSFSGYGFAVPSNMVSKVVGDLIQYGVVQRGYLGVVIRNINGDFAREKDLDVTEGAYIDSVLQGSAAQKAGIRPGDVVRKVDGVEIDEASKLQEEISNHHPGDKVSLTIDRRGKISTVNAVLQSYEGKTVAVSNESSELKSLLGADFKAIDRSTARKLNIKGGVEITKLLPGKLSRQTDVRKGFIIIKVNDTPVTTVDELYKALKSRKGGVLLEGVYEDVPGVYYYAFGL